MRLTPATLTLLSSIGKKPWQRYPTSTWGRAARAVNTLVDAGCITETVRVWQDDQGLERRARILEITPAGIEALTGPRLGKR